MDTFVGVAFFLKLAGRLKRELRKGWIKKVGVKIPESVADHTFRTVLVSMVIGDISGMDTCKMIRMALIHDLAEAVTGDIISGASMNPKIKMAIDDRAMRDILGYLPQNLQKRYYALWKDWLEASSLEAMMVQEIDKLEMALQASDYRDEGYSEEKLDEFMVSALGKIQDKNLLKLLHHLKG